MAKSLGPAVHIVALKSIADIADTPDAREFSGQAGRVTRKPRIAVISNKAATIKAVWLLIFDSRSALVARYFKAVSRAVIPSLSVSELGFEDILHLNDASIFQDSAQLYVSRYAQQLLRMYRNGVHLWENRHALL